LRIVLGQQQLTWADIALFEATNAALEAYGISKIRPYVKLKEFHDKVAARVSSDSCGPL
jgi:glutathione S-transferase